MREWERKERERGEEKEKLREREKDDIVKDK